MQTSYTDYTPTVKEASNRIFFCYYGDPAPVGHRVVPRFSVDFLQLPVAVLQRFRLLPAPHGPRCSHPNNAHRDPPVEVVPQNGANGRCWAWPANVDDSPRSSDWTAAMKRAGFILDHAPELLPEVASGTVEERQCTRYSGIPE